MAVDNSRKKTTPPRPNLPPEGQPWGRWVTDTLNELKLETGGVKREVISSNKNHNAQLQMSAQQKREIIKAHLKAEEALNIALAASGSTTIYFVAPENPEPGDIWYENVTGIWFRWVDDQWTPITDETLLEALEAILAQRIANDDKIRTFAQDTEPTGMTTEHVGDLWYDTDDKNKLYRWDGLQWVPIRDAGITEAKDAADAAQGTADAAQDAADTAKQTADNAAGAVSQLEAQVTTDLGAMQGRLDTAEGELYDLENVTLPALDSRLGSAESAVSASEGRLTGAEGELATLNGDLSQLDTALSDLQSEVDNLVIPSVDGLNKITYSTAAPSATAGYKAGDTWRQYAGSGSNRKIIGEWQFTGSAWNPLQLRNEMISSLDAGKITTGFLDAGRIEANTITAEKLVIASGENLLVDPSIAVPSAWTFATGVTFHATGGMNGGPSVTVQGAGSNRTFYNASTSAASGRLQYMVRVTPGASYSLSLWFKTPEPVTGAAVGIVSGFVDEDGGVVRANFLAGSATSPTADTWYQATATVVASEGAAYMTFAPSVRGTNTTLTTISNPAVRARVGATLIEDGAITTEKVDAEAITGAKIKAGSITASHGVFATGAIQNADIGNLNASKINAGTLNANRIGADTIEGKHIKGGTITATHGVFATGAIQAADIASINADTITVGTLSGINIQGVNLQGVTISGEYLTLASSAPTVHTLGNLGTQGFDVTTLPTHPIAPSQTLGFFDVVISTSASTPGIPAPYSVFRVGGNRLGSESLPYSPITYFGQWSTYYGKPMGLTTDGAVIQGDTRLEDAEISDAHISALYPSAIYSAQGKTNIDVYDPINIPNNVPLKVNNIQVGSYESRITISGQTRVEGALSATSATITGNATVNGTTTLNGATTIENGNFSGVYGDGSEETGRFFGRQFGGATRSSNQNLSTTSTTTIVLNSTSGYSSRHVSLSGGGLSVARGGYYIVEAAVQFDGSRSSYWRNLIIQVNGSTRRTQPSIASGDSRMASTTAAFELDAGDTVTLATNGSNNSTGMRVHQNVYLTVTRVGA